MNFTDSKITEIYFLVDEFNQQFQKQLSSYLVGNAPKRPPTLSSSEVMTIMILFYDKGYRCMKHFYTQYVQKHLTAMFPKTVSYNRFTELMQSANLPFFCKPVVWAKIQAFHLWIQHPSEYVKK